MIIIRSSFGYCLKLDLLTWSQNELISSKSEKKIGQTVPYICCLIQLKLYNQLPTTNFDIIIRKKLCVIMHLMSISTTIIRVPYCWVVNPSFIYSICNVSTIKCSYQAQFWSRCKALYCRCADLMPGSVKHGRNTSDLSASDKLRRYGLR